MTGLLAGIAAVAVPLVLLASVVGQVRHPRALAAALRAHRVFPRRSAAALAVTVIAVEALTGLGGAAALLRWLDGPMRAASWAAAVLLALYALYGTFVSRTRTGVPCGCAGDGTPMTGWVAGRAAALALLALTGALHGLPAGSTAYEMFIAVAAGLGFAVLLWTLPRALLTERRTAG
ncbi:MauE/DoxX family redox-associated membrane protein [Actinomadura sp. BRA 177]|uniref:MauE/DoxX family redox-associated membrane protein n=1 Tax=Actinomadura sp. BRA 177 TaxID=2745202 RepID=UPI001595FDB3|nr:MauE/DoxX family redox-associated membrane protein [Actinomadura sp. BRA 177]NVI89814.1 methylamine utilization protein MauE [Actinomadura sp. BRA 177]